MKFTRRTFLLSSAATLAASPALAQDALRPAKWQPKLSENLADVRPETLRWLKQLGCRHVIFQGTDSVDADHKGSWSAADVQRVHKNCTDAGLILESMMIPIDFYRKARLGQKGRDDEIDNVCRTI